MDLAAGSGAVYLEFFAGQRAGRVQIATENSFPGTVLAHAGPNHEVTGGQRTDPGSKLIAKNECVNRLHRPGDTGSGVSAGEDVPAIGFDREVLLIPGDDKSPRGPGRYTRVGTDVGR